MSRTVGLQAHCALYGVEIPVVYSKNVGVNVTQRKMDGWMNGKKINQLERQETSTASVALMQCSGRNEPRLCSNPPGFLSDEPAVMAKIVYLETISILH